MYLIIPPKSRTTETSCSCHSSSALVRSCTEGFSGQHRWLHSCRVSVGLFQVPFGVSKGCSFHRYCSWPDSATVLLSLRKKKMSVNLCVPVKGKRAKRYLIFLYSQGYLYASPFIPWVYVYNFSGSLNRSHHLPKKIFITTLNLYQSVMWEMGLGKAEVRHSAVKDRTTVNSGLQQDK